ncbi:hypothetical protein E2C01_086327 [Portunus trituberculatus]|uniref:Uncharacterized protein n=1 Tax=Portunus trituberculatus TaxID=210409 RepID=A0A5B7J545_PORTR|nr:hypothetical protein [Portunus trituberculatus]
MLPTSHTSQLLFYPPATLPFPFSPTQNHHDDVFLFHPTSSLTNQTKIYLSHQLPAPTLAVHPSPTHAHNALRPSVPKVCVCVCV